MWITERFRIEKLLGKGGFSRVYQCLDKETGQRCALKLDTNEALAGSRSLVEYEAMVMQYIFEKQTGAGIPQVVWKGSAIKKGKQLNMLVMNLLGVDLESILSKRLTLTVLEASHLIVYLLDTVEKIHAAGFVHRDLKPANLILGHGDDNKVYVADFGLAKKYLHPNGSHIAFTDKKSGVTGTLRFCSVHTHNCEESSRRDDIESLMYVFAIMVAGRLPWQGLKDRNQIKHVKQTSTVEAILPDCPKEVHDAFRYVRNLGFLENPDYGALRNLFTNVISDLRSSDHGRGKQTSPLIS